MRNTLKILVEEQGLSQSILETDIPVWAPKKCVQKVEVRYCA